MTARVLPLGEAAVSRRATWIGVAGLGALAALFLAPGLVLGPAQDGAIFSTIGEELARGSLPYRDAWDHKPPLIYVVAAVASLLPGPTWPGVWVATLVAVAISGWVVYRLAGWPAAAVFVAASSIYPVAYGGGQTEHFAAAATAVSLLAVVSGHPVRGGLSAAVALGFSLQALPYLPALFIVARRRWLTCALGLLGGLLALVAVLALVGVLPEAIDALGTYNRLYLSSFAGADEIPSMVAGLSALVVLALPGVREPKSRLGWACLAWVGTAALLFAVQGRHLGHYVAPTLIPLSILAARSLRGPIRWPIAVASIVVMILLSAPIVARQWRSHLGPPTMHVGDWIRERTEPSDQILVWGVDTNVYLVSQREPAGRYPYLMPLVTPGYTTSETIAAWIGDLAGEPPSIIVDAEAANPHWPESDDYFRPPPPGAAGGRDIDLLDPLREFVDENYRFVAEIRGRKIYALVDIDG